MVVKVHQSKHLPGSMLASLAVRWGFSKGDGDLGGYHLVWAHAEHLKLVRSLADGADFDTPPQPLERYAKRSTVSKHVPWRFNHKIRDLPTDQLAAGSELQFTFYWSEVGRWEGADFAVKVH